MYHRKNPLIKTQFDNCWTGQGLKFIWQVVVIIFEFFRNIFIRFINMKCRSMHELELIRLNDTIHGPTNPWFSEKFIKFWQMWSANFEWPLVCKKLPRINSNFRQKLYKLENTWKWRVPTYKNYYSSYIFSSCDLLFVKWLLKIQ